jgi:GTP-binding protein EngB required for normal cell division
MTATLTDSTQTAADRAGLSARLTALARMVQIGNARSGPDGFSDELLAAASDLLTRAGERLMLSSEHTVVALAGGTGSGKSSLFNQLAGADFSTVGVTRPVTREAHACVWGMAGSGPLLEWLGVPRRYRYARASALSRGEQSMNGLVLLDMPDHDSVMGHATDLVNKLVGMSDLMVWVLDPQKYADAAVHRRFLVPLAGHAEVVAVVLNQADLLTAGEIEDCVQDLRRLLDSEGLQNVQVLVTSAVTGAGIEELRKLLIEAVSVRRAAVARISADVDGVAARFERYAAADGTAAGAGGAAADGATPGEGAAAAEDALRGGAGAEIVSARSHEELTAAFASASGVPAIGEALCSAKELRAMDYVGWPVSWITERLTSRDPVRKIKLGRLWQELRDVTAGPTGAQQAEIDNALTRVGDELATPLPRPWSRTVRAAARSRSEDIPAVLGAEIRDALPDGTVVDPWWRAVGVLQGLLLGSALVGLAWLATLVVCGVFGVGSAVPKLFSTVMLVPVAAGVVAVALVGGWLTARAGAGRVSNAAERETEQLTDVIRQRMAGVAHDLVIVPVEIEFSEFERFRSELRVAAAAERR